MMSVEYQWLSGIASDRHDNIIRINFEDGIFTFFHADENITTRYNLSVVRISEVLTKE